MKKLIKLFKNLPPEMRMFLAMAGLGSPIGIMYALKRWIFPNTPLIVIILGVFAVVAVICLIGFLIAFLFGRGTQKRSKKMAAELAGGAESGPVSMDVRASIKENNDKFFNAIRDMRKLGISIYELPWYVVIGDSGCGKTRLINEGGLTFSTGKPEGYQLGTLNYNWWFTEDAIFVDMAGRLCNPKDDSDYREWEAFLNSVKKGRKGFPINGVIACVSADHLLQDAPERLEKDANTMLERLRDLQGKLGVTFATYLVITKCDKILGFMQYFDRAERDITIKNQIFGWSRPGDFKELYDPERFAADFQLLYGRMNDLRLRRLNDEAEEIDIGLAYSFPEEFRGMLDPLQIYVRTLFPAIKNPRAIKNLIFRGIYFTSATQEGALILKHLTERLGRDAAEQFAPLDLYPNKRPHFIKDLFFRKVFPEHGLVFRNEEQAERNKKLAKVMNISSGILAVVLVALLWWSGSTFSKLIGAPRDAAVESVDPARVSDPPSALRLAAQIDEHAAHLQANMLPARILSLGFGAHRPVTYLKDIQLSLFEDRILRRALADVDAVLRSTDLATLHRTPDGEKVAGQYADALAQYVTWFGCSAQVDPPSTLTLEGFRTLCRVVSDKGSIIHQEKFDEQASEYFLAVTNVEWKHNPSRFLAGREFAPPETIRAAIGKMHGYLMRYATLDKSHPDAVIQEWMRIQEACAALVSRYGSILDIAGKDVHTVQDVQGLRENLVKDFAAFHDAFGATEWSVGGGQYFKIASIKQAILNQRKRWLDYAQKLRDGYTACGATPNADVMASLGALGNGQGLPAPGLDAILWDSLRRTGLTTYNYQEGNYDEKRFDELVEEVYEAYAHIIQYVPGEGPDPDRIKRTADAEFVHGLLKQIRDTMAGAEAGDDKAAGRTMDAWASMLDANLKSAETPAQAVSIPEGFDAKEKWRRRDLEQFYKSYQDILRRGQATQMLSNIRKHLAEVGEWGLAEVTGGDPNWCAEQPSVYRIPVPPCGKVVAAQPEKTERGREEQPARPGRRGRRGRTRDSAPVTEKQPTGDRRITAQTLIPVAATRDFLNQTVDQWDELQVYLDEFGPDDFLRSDDGEAMNVQCGQDLDQAGRRYFESYVRSWSDAYRDHSLKSIEDLKSGAGTWQTLLSRRGARTSVDNEFSDSLRSILGALPYSSAFPVDSGRWEIPEGGFYDGLLSKAIDASWDPDLGPFVYNRELPSDFRDGKLYVGDPATLVTGAFVDRWNALLGALEANADVRTRWSRARKSRTLSVSASPIPWGKVQELRDQVGLSKEKLTQQLVDFEEHAKYLLSIELTDILDSVQNEHLGGVKTAAGWPYVDDGGRGGEMVDFEKFVAFLVEVGRAEREFSALEAGFQDDLARERDRYYGACRQWRQFLGLDENGKSAALGVIVWGGDPLRDERFKARSMQDTAQQFYRTAELYLGDLAWSVEQQSGVAQQGNLARSTSVEGRAMRFQTKWDWTQVGDRPLTVGLKDGENVSDTQQTFQDIQGELGKASPLALCWYLQKFGYCEADRQVWKTLHEFAVNDPTRGKITIGEMFVFKLDRAMPEPIGMLAKAQGGP